VPGLADPLAIKAVADAVAPKPLDIELTQPGLTAAALGELGVRRISVGDSFAEMTRAGLDREAQHFIDFDDLPTECARSNSRRALSRGSRPIK
jgi:2-methylisocitrate lyase-like PEP mutase family enzyme